MNLIKEIELTKILIEKKLMLLELDNRFNELVNILKNNYAKLEAKYKTIEKDFDYKNYYAELSYFFDSDMQMVLDLYNKHQNDNDQIYDDSNQELNEELLKKKSEIQKCIEETKKTYDDESIASFIENKYLLIVNKYEQELNNYYTYSSNIFKMHLVIKLENTPLNLYRSSTLIKERYLQELSSVLDDFVKYVNMFIENKQKVIEKEKYIIDKLNIIKNQQFENEFYNLKNNFDNEIKKIHSLDIKVNNLQKDYFDALETLLFKILEEEKNILKKDVLNNYILYLKNEDIYEIKFSILHNIFAYLEENDNLELKDLLYLKYYEILKRELKYNNGKSIIVDSLGDDFIKELEKYFFNDLKKLKKYQNNELVKSYIKMFLTRPFSLSLLKEFSELIINDKIDFEISKSDNTDLGNDDLVILDYRVHSSNKKEFDENGYAVVRTNDKDEYYVVSKRYGSAFKFDAHYKNLLNNCQLGQMYIADAFLGFYYRAFIPDKYGIIKEQKGIMFLDVDFKTPLCDMKDYHPPFNKKYRIDKILPPSANSVWVTSAIDHKSYYIHYTGKKILTLHNGTPTRFGNGYCLVRNRLNVKDREVYINHKGKIVWKVPLGYEAEPFNHGYALIFNSNDIKKSYIINEIFEKAFTDYEVTELLDDGSVRLKDNKGDKIYYLYEGELLCCEDYLIKKEKNKIENYCLAYYKNNPSKYCFIFKEKVKYNSLKEELTLSKNEFTFDNNKSEKEIKTMVKANKYK